MKIALLVQRFPGGGAENYVEEIAKRLHHQGEDVIIVTSENKNCDDLRYDFKIIRLSSLLNIGEYSIWRGLEKVLAEEQFDIIHTNTYGYYHSDKVANLKKKYGYKLVMTSHGFHGTDLHQLKKNKIINKTSKFDFFRELYDSKIGKQTILNSDHLIALSNKEKKFYKNLGVDSSKISIIPPGIKESFFVSCESKINLDGEPNLITVGELSWVKSKSLIIRAMPKILETLPNTKLYIIGKNKDQSSNLEYLIKKLNLTENVFILGSVSEKKLLSYLHSADILIHTSLAEGLSTILLESMAVGLPFITTPAGGNGELANNSNAGIETPFEDEKTLADNVIQFFDKEKLQKSSKFGKNYSKNINWDNVYKQILNIYSNLSEK